jgi:hypothetical protein|tara:strand:+ start:7146 stop:8087 length:942 start_codon:yes stop_codon:yes gene_type:complete
MQNIKKFFEFSSCSALLLITTIAAAQTSTFGERFLSLPPPAGMPLVPVMEGWVANIDGTTSFSFGFINRNDKALDIPVGPNNYIEPAKYNGMQPTHFPTGRGTGVFAVTVPQAEVDEDVWWYVTTGDSETLKVPGRAGASAYELDFILPRPQGSMQPLLGFDEGGPLKAGLSANISDHQSTVQVGSRVELVVNVDDPSNRDTADPRFAEALSVGVVFNKYQGPGNVVFSRHETIPAPVNPYEPDDFRFRFYREPGANTVEVKGGSGSAPVYATFSEPGDYILHIKANNFQAPDSSDGDQCCWTNVYRNITVAP